LPCASFTSFVRAALAFWMSEVISVAAPGCMLTWTSWSSEARRAATSAHRTELDGEAAAGDEGDEVAVDVPPGEVLADVHPASSARPHAVTTSFHRVAPVTVRRFMALPGSRADRHPRLTRNGLFGSGRGQACSVVLPVHDLNPLRRTPWVTYALVAANVIVLLLTPASRESVTGPAAQAQLCSQTAFYDRYAAIPRELTTNRQLLRVATGQPGPTPDTCYVGRPTYHKEPALSVLFAMFLHAGWLHLLGNMLFLIVFGNNIEDRFRKLPYLLFYLFCGYVAAYGFAFANQASVQPLIGASGAIAGVGLIVRAASPPPRYPVHPRHA
jgi:membrane associated rhomboid family serine protease